MAKITTAERKDKLVQANLQYPLSKGILKEKSMASGPLIINVCGITDILHRPEQRKGGLALLKKAIDKILHADGAKYGRAGCDFNEEGLSLAVTVAGKEFVKVTANQPRVGVLQNGKTTYADNDNISQGKVFTELLAQIAKWNGVKVELEGMGMY